MPKIAMGITYDGSNFNGWQYQNDELPTIQLNLESAISKVADEKITTICAGRTDRGVHALGQVVHFGTTAIREERGWLLGTNSYLDPRIRVMWVKPVIEDFHARYSAQARRYKYIIHEGNVSSALLYNRVTNFYHKLDESLMQEAGNYLIGEHDFTSYRAQECQAKTPVRNIIHLNITRQKSFIIIDVKANGFLHHMVRNITGVLLSIGSGKQKPIWAKEVLEAKNRSRGDVTAPAAGLYLYEVEYPLQFQLPNFSDNLFII